MSERSVVRLKGSQGTGDPTPREIVAAQLRGEAKADIARPQAVVKAVAQELAALGLEPDLKELSRRYQGDDHRVAVLTRSMQSSGS